jgi:hypothetical protein
MKLCHFTISEWGNYNNKVFLSSICSYIATYMITINLEQHACPSREMSVTRITIMYLQGLFRHDRHEYTQQWYHKYCNYRRHNIIYRMYKQYKHYDTYEFKTEHNHNWRINLAHQNHGFRGNKHTKKSQQQIRARF